MKQQTLVPSVYPSRAEVGNPFDWDDAAYKPHEFNLGLLLTDTLPPWADSPNLCDSTVLGSRLSYTDDHSETRTTVAEKCTVNKRGRYRNPKGKTGLCGRGMLGRWGPNHAADVIVTRTVANKCQVLLVQKHAGDEQSSLAFPAGMVEPGSDVPSTLRTELTQEAVKDSEVVDRLFNECRRGVVYRGHVDDFRNTDEAWMETTACWFHATDDIANALQLSVSDTDEIKGVAWYDIDYPTAMYASHLSWLHTVRDCWNKEVSEASASSSGKRKRAADDDDAMPTYVS